MIDDSFFVIRNCQTQQLYSPKNGRPSAVRTHHE